MRSHGAAELSSRRCVLLLLRSEVLRTVGPANGSLVFEFGCYCFQFVLLSSLDLLSVPGAPPKAIAIGFQVFKFRFFNNRCFFRLSGALPRLRCQTSVESSCWHLVCTFTRVLRRMYRMMRVLSCWKSALGS
jgi:hypothetical protein